mmetsp:Transcript_63290/g.150964  ORF Transcript_63290/g.150964 Transcript_63290/m.150964 type:complete len:209 (-) Transcript_63290:373-999(-)
MPALGSTVDNIKASVLDDVEVLLRRVASSYELSAFGNIADHGHGGHLARCTVADVGASSQVRVLKERLHNEADLFVAQGGQLLSGLPSGTPNLGLILHMCHPFAVGDLLTLVDGRSGRKNELMLQSKPLEGLPRHGEGHERLFSSGHDRRHVWALRCESMSTKVVSVIESRSHAVSAIRVFHNDLGLARLHHIEGLSFPPLLHHLHAR